MKMIFFFLGEKKNLFSNWNQEKIQCSNKGLKIKAENRAWTRPVRCASSVSSCSSLPAASFNLPSSFSSFIFSQHKVSKC